ncbi:MAG: hypothetical protein WCJ09_07705 [Planctomycetota bacterium]
MAKPPLSGKFDYQSFYNGPIRVQDGKVEGTSILAERWSPVGTLDVATSVRGEVFGRLLLPPNGVLGFQNETVLNVTGQVMPASEHSLARVELRGEGMGAVYQIHGWFVPDLGQVVGTVLCLTGDLAKRPVGTTGAFILFPKN